MATTTARGSYWVQVGAFKSEETAKRVAAKLRDLSYEVHEFTTRSGKTSTATSAAASGPSPTDRYDVFVSGAAAAEVTAKLAAKGFAADAVAGGVVVKPSLPLRDAVALSRDLTADGLKVQVKRASGSASASSATADRGAGATLYRVRVGKFNDRASAQAAAKELEGKGYKGFIARGTE
jgi:cell division septation protein DedD